MSGRHRREGVSVGHDAFLDIVANLVGILIILVVVLGAQSEAVMRDAKPQVKEPLDPKSRIAAEAEMETLATVAARAASAQADSMRLERTIKVLDSKIAQQAERRTILLTLLTEAEAAWEDEQTKLDDANRQAAIRNAEASKLKNELAELAGARTQLESKQPPIVAISHLPTPMAKTVFGEEVYFRLKDDRLSVIPFELLADEIGRNFRRTSSSLREGVSDAAVGPVRGYVARYVLNRSNELVSNGNAIARMSRARVVVASFEPLREPHGTPIEEVLANDDWLDVELSQYPPGTTTVTVAVYPDSYGSFRKLREKIYAKGYASAARPIKEGSPIYVNFAGGGTRSVAQ
ncbi:hypothetical protein Enr13x_66050 [Stieleria neptunia]|uniref:Uncharacterized protein n=1 Tax=Stieleria neptunia TaxID=2527979 RepID=A0A518I0R0_9BACT|nr:hypothetical protein [Stieleria neptunia]QDV46696.1 hypothetical protein Enr13x_66050 [Stieleria neptunia]